MKAATILFPNTGNRIVATFMPGVAIADSTQAQAGALYGAMFFNGLLGILGTGGIKAALIANQQAQAVLIECNQSN